LCTESGLDISLQLCSTFEASLPHDAVLPMSEELGKLSVSMVKVKRLEVGVTTSVVGVSRAFDLACDVDDVKVDATVENVDDGNTFILLL